MNPVDLDSDWDNLYTTDEGRLVSWYGTRYTTLDDFQVATTYELDGLATAPDLPDPAEGDFANTRQSPLVDRGIWLPGINDEFSGKGPDIGASEYVLPQVPSIPAILLDH